MIYVTGDLHADYLRLIKLNEFLRTKINEISGIIVLGDFGIPWSDDVVSIHKLNELRKLPYKIFFIDGNHENFDLLKQYPSVTIFGGKAHKLNENVYHLKRGQVYEIDGKKLFTFGGAASIDKQYRIEGQSWWPDEIYSQKEKKDAIANLEKHNWKVDYVLTHTGPLDIIKKMGLPNDIFDPTTLLLNSFYEKLRFNRWFFGHFHEYRKTKNIITIYKEFVRLEVKIDNKHK